jgi:hypothetical protein
MEKPLPTEEPIICKVCDRGNLIRKRLYRLAGAPVFIGYLLLIPSAVGFCIAIVFEFVILSASANQSGNPQTNAIISALGTGFVGVALIVTMIGSLLGELLIMKKRVLQCSTCGATISAS